ncbi:DUF4190 domain-containing protein [Alkalihalophilus marmarensis]|uniref:DUF4190 domain-containing protein n=1 Tax=Alkalihalophilus marmarensis DSM 21297 TaxID=1188261 RepID=U6ST95_9BACI|nr:DUF4190 domain-containing protein [Alkalihalophilus marmarensis]ERN53861.1 hypothetical protein A33I_09555 [Alkalihalophilus marmarensis DSM 21297]
MHCKSLEKGTNGKALGSFLTGISAIIGLFFFKEGTILSIVGLMLGVIGLKEIKRYEQKGNKLALVGTFFSLIGFIGFTMFIVWS